MRGASAVGLADPPGRCIGEGTAPGARAAR